MSDDSVLRAMVFGTGYGVVRAHQKAIFWVPADSTLHLNSLECNLRPFRVAGIAVARGSNVGWQLH